MTLPPGLQARLDAIGPHERDDMGWTWRGPAALAVAFPGVILSMDCEADDDPIGGVEAMLAAFDGIVEDAEQIARDAERACIAVFRDSDMAELDDDELASYRGPDGNVSDERIAGAVSVGEIAIAADGDGVYVDLHCSSEWDPEHGVPLEYRDGEVGLKV